MDNFQGYTTGAGMSAKNKNCANLLSDICSPRLFCLHFFHLSRSACAEKRKTRSTSHYLKIQLLCIPYGKNECLVCCWWWHAKTTAYSMNPYIYLYSLPVHTSASCLVLDGKLIQAAATFLLCACTATKTGESWFRKGVLCQKVAQIKMPLCKKDTS